MEEELEKIAEALAKLEQKIMVRKAEFVEKTADMQREVKDIGTKYVDLRTSTEETLKQLDALIDEMEKEE